MEKILLILSSIFISAFIYIPVGVLIRKKIVESKLGGAEAEAIKMLEDAKRESEEIIRNSENLLKEAKKESENFVRDEQIKAREAALKIKTEFDDEIKTRRKEISTQENRLIQKEENIDRRQEKIENEERKIISEFKELEKDREHLVDKEKELQQDILDAKEKQRIKLEEIAALTREEAKDQILNDLNDKLIKERAKILRDNEAKLKDESDKIAREILSTAIQQCAADHTSESTITVVDLPSDEMKGRIIGKEGRNIKALEMQTGVQFIIDDTPETITISGFDPVRREIASRSLLKLMEDGRIQPAKIEEVVDKTIEKVTEIIKEEGERATYETAIHDLHPDLVKVLGKLKFRTSYGQNVLNHSIEVANLSKLIAKELGLDTKLAARAGLLHDIGKALDHDPNVEGTHASLGGDLIQKYGESDLVVNAVRAHHDEVEPQSLEALIVQAADAISASRPGARRDSFEAYIQRLQNLEEIANSYDGVKKSFAIQAGREIRVLVDPEKVSDDNMKVIAREIAEKVENELSFPGEIKVNIIRENRSINYAKQSKVGRTIIQDTSEYGFDDEDIIEEKNEKQKNNVEEKVERQNKKHQRNNKINEQPKKDRNKEQKDIKPTKQANQKRRKPRNKMFKGKG